MATGPQPLAVNKRERFFIEFKEHLTVEFVKDVADNFFENIRRTEALISLPAMMVGFLQVEREFYDRQTETVKRHWGGSFAKYLEELKASHKAYSPSKVPDLPTKIKKRFEEMLEAPVFGPVLRASTEVLRSSAVLSSWSAFEFLATDLWVCAVNHMPLPLAHRAFTGMEDFDSELSAKHISVGLAAKHGFDPCPCT